MSEKMKKLNGKRKKYVQVQKALRVLMESKILIETGSDDDVIQSVNASLRENIYGWQQAIDRVDYTISKIKNRMEK